jgi:hypothetical protein
MTVEEIGKRYVELVRAGKREECLATLFSPDATSAEPFPPPGRERMVKGIDALRGKSKFFFENNEVHRDEVDGPYPHGDRFAVRFSFEVTFKPAGLRRTRDEIGLFTVVDGKIASEEFFYSAG